ncbi:hypothetical protein ACK8P5_26370 (plasmid) [Paenibacillus sp. EC2-1]|uniref:hypothetical protein n=1 Tax=Paenibacillus sp. EC2-1 TaxID=3388665 RepID=UPI003BEEED67
MTTYEIEYNDLTSRYDIIQIYETSQGPVRSLIQTYDDRFMAEGHIAAMRNSQAIKGRTVAQDVDFDNNVRDRLIRDHVLHSLTPQTVAKLFSIDQIAQSFFYKIGGMPSEDSVERLLEKVYEEEKKLHAQRTIRMSNGPKGITHTNYLDMIEDSVKRLPGVTDVIVLADDYPRSASMIIKLRMGHLTPDESVQTMEAIGATIEQHKSSRLKLEVIYHTTEVY